MRPRYAAHPEGLMQWVRFTESGCWNWTGPINRAGYGRASLRTRSALAHRLAYEVFIGPIPVGLELDHLCSNRRCIRPDHLEPVTHAENVRRGSRPSQTHCRYGHPFDEQNTYHRPRGGRACRRCGIEATRRYLQRKAA